MSFETFGKPTVCWVQSGLAYSRQLSMNVDDISGLVSMEWDAIWTFCCNNDCSMSSINIFTMMVERFMISINSLLQQESCAIAKITARCAYLSIRQYAHGFAARKSICTVELHSRQNNNPKQQQEEEAEIRGYLCRPSCFHYASRLKYHSMKSKTVSLQQTHV